MKIIITSLIFFFVLTLFSGIFVAKTIANTLSPLDFGHSYQKFEIQVGFNRDNGRYFNYHYEF